MSSSPTAPTSTTASSSNSPSEPPLEWIVRDVTAPDSPLLGVGTERPGGRPGRVALVACGALAQPAAEIAERRGWSLDVHPLPPLLHNQPHLITGRVRELVLRLREAEPAYDRIVIGYADCGTYGALDDLCTELGLERLAGLHCYDVYAGADRLAAFFEEQPGTYVFTDFLVRSFHRTVVRELGLDRWPELRDDYFKGYTRVVWLAQEPDDELTALADEAAGILGLPLTVVDTGHTGLERALAHVLRP